MAGGEHTRAPGGTGGSVDRPGGLRWAGRVGGACRLRTLRGNGIVHACAGKGVGRGLHMSKHGMPWTRCTGGNAEGPGSRIRIARAGVWVGKQGRMICGTVFTPGV